MRNEGSGNVTGLKFESRTRTQSRTRMITTTTTTYRLPLVPHPYTQSSFCHLRMNQDGGFEFVKVMINHRKSVYSL